MLIHWIWYAESKLKAAQKRLLLEYFRDPEEIYYSDEIALQRVEGMTDSMREALEDKDLSQAERILAECEDKHIHLLTFGDEAYPARLRSIFDAPVLLYYRGTLPDWEAVPVIGVVGTRKASPYGCSTALRFGRQIAACGALVISGGAAGIDTMALQGALEMGRPVAAVLGCGVDVVYPASNRKLFDRILEDGCLISEYPPQSEAFSWHFPVRNRILAGISNGLLVVEAPEKSGALNSARHALEQGRDVFSVPGNVDMPTCAGTNALLQEGAKPAITGWDVVKEYEALYPGKVHRRDVPVASETPVQKVAQQPVFPESLGNIKKRPDKKSIDNLEKSTYSVLNNAVPALSEAEQAVLTRISREGSLVDDIIAQADMSPGAVKSILTKLALKKLVIQHPGGRVSLK